MPRASPFGALLRQHAVALVDRGTQRAGGGKFFDDVGRNRAHGGLPFRWTEAVVKARFGGGCRARAGLPGACFTGGAIWSIPAALRPAAFRPRLVPGIKLVPGIRLVRRQRAAHGKGHRCEPRRFCSASGSLSGLPPAAPASPVCWAADRARPEAAPTRRRRPPAPRSPPAHRPPRLSPPPAPARRRPAAVRNPPRSAPRRRSPPPTPMRSARRGLCAGCRSREQKSLRSIDRRIAFVDKCIADAMKP